MKILTVVFLLSVNINAFAQMGTGAVDAAILTETVIHTGQNAESITTRLAQLETMLENLDISRRIEQMEQLKAVKQFTDTGRAMHKFMDGVQGVYDKANNLKETQFGFKTLKNDVQWLEGAIKDAADGRDAANIMVELKNLSFLGKMVRESKVEIGGGSDDVGNKRITAVSTTIMADLMQIQAVDAKQDKEHKDKNTKEVMKSIMSTEYSNLGGLWNND